VPGVILYLSSFYKRHMLQLRFSAIASVSSIAGAFSGLLAAAIQNMDGIRGLPGWAWLFILVRSISILFSIFNAMLRKDYSQLSLVSLESSCSLLLLTTFHLHLTWTKVSMLQNLPGTGAEIGRSTNSPGKKFLVFL
jgi:MFS family permease